jgi:hypothetical protein
LDPGSSYEDKEASAEKGKEVEEVDPLIEMF